MTTALFFCAVELTLRWSAWPPAAVLETDALVIRRTVDGDDWRGHHAFGDEDFELDPAFLEAPNRSPLWLPRADHPLFQEDRATGVPVTRQRSPGVLRVLALGDSNTLGDGATSWPHQLAVPAHGDPAVGSCGNIEVSNLGVHGYSSFQGLARLRRTLSSLDDRALPHVVVVCFGWNDAVPVSNPPDREWGAALAATGWLTEGATPGGPWRATAIGRAVHWLAVQESRRSVQPRVSVEEFVANHMEMARLCEERGLAFVPATRPFALMDDVPHLEVDVGHEHEVGLYAARLREAAAREGWPLWDLEGVARSWGADLPTRFVDPCHFSEEGHSRAALSLLSTLAAHGADLCPTSE